VDLGKDDDGDEHCQEDRKRQYLGDIQGIIISVAEEKSTGIDAVLTMPPCPFSITLSNGIDLDVDIGIILCEREDLRCPLPRRGSSA
jgi:hypothetical protein